MAGPFELTGEATGLTNRETPIKKDVDLLKRFYAAYGVPDEGPPHDFDVTVMTPGLSVPRRDLDDLRAVLANQATRRQFGICREILDDLASRLTSKELLRELSTLPGTPEEDPDDLANGVFWFSLAASLDQRRDRLPTTPFDEHIDLPLPLRVRMSMAGSLVLRLYLALVYMREGRLSRLITQGAKARKPCCGRVKKLLDADYVRRIRNSLSHGSFSVPVAGLAFRDGGGVIVATPGFLNWLCTWLKLIQLQAFAAGSC